MTTWCLLLCLKVGGLWTHTGTGSETSNIWKERLHLKGIVRLWVAKSSTVMRTTEYLPPEHGRMHVRQSRQNFTYSGVNSHFQSGVAEWRIRELQELAQACLLHGRYLKGMADEGLIMRPNPSKGMEVHPMQIMPELGNQLVLERMLTRLAPVMVTLFLTVVCPCFGSPKCRQRLLCQALKPRSLLWRQQQERTFQSNAF
jgi:hypothetical protein